MISLLPPAHIAVVPAERISAASMSCSRSCRARRNATSSMVLITGPSRTADIEQILVRGVQGRAKSQSWWWASPNAVTSGLTEGHPAGVLPLSQVVKLWADMYKIFWHTTSAPPIVVVLRRRTAYRFQNESAAVGNPPTDAGNWNRCAQRPPERKNEISHQTQDRESGPEHFPLMHEV